MSILDQIKPILWGISISCLYSPRGKPESLCERSVITEASLKKDVKKVRSLPADATAQKPKKTSYPGNGSRIDITDRKNEGLYRTLAERSMAGVYVVQDGRFTYLNKMAASYAGYEPEELIGTNAMALVLPEDREKVRKRGTQMLHGLSASPYEFRIRTKDGGLRWIMETVTSITFNHRPAVLGNSMDVTETKLTTEELERVQGQQKALLDNIPDIAWMKDAEGRYIAVNEAFGKFCGKDTGAVIGRSALEIFPPELAQRFHAEDQAVMAGRRRTLVEKSIVTEKGEEAWHETIKTPILNERNEVIGMVGIARDISERRKAEKVLRESEARFRLLAENVKDVILLTGLDGRILYVSPSVEQMIGYPLDELREKKYRDVMTPRTLLAVKTYLKEKIWNGKAAHLDPGRPSVMEVEAVCRDGSVKDVEVKFSILLNDTGEPYRILGVMRDISKRKAAEKALKDSEERLRTYLDSMQDLVFLKDEQSRFLMVNHAFEQFGGVKEQDIIGKTDADYYPAGIAGPFMESDRKVVEGQSMVAGEVTLGSRCFEWRKFPVSLGDGRMGVGGCVRDITEHKRAEEALRESEAKFRTLANNIPLGVIIHENGVLRYVGAQVAAMLGYENPHEFIGSHVMDFIHEDDRPRVLEISKQRITGEAVPDVYEARLIRKDGASMDALIHSAMMIDEGGRKVTLTVFTDITERKEVEAALRESEAKFRVLADNTPFGILIHHNGIIQYAGREAGRMAGHENVGECIGRSIMEHIHEEDRARVADITRRRIAGEDAPNQYEARLVRKDGSVIDVLISAMMIEYGGQRCTQSALMDITEHRKAAEALRQSEAKLQGLLRAAPIGIGLIRKRVFEWVSQGLCLMTGYSPEELSGNRVDFLYADRQESLRAGAALRKQLYRKGVGSVETRWKTKDGRVIDVVLRCAIGEGAGRSASVVLTAMDITDIKNTEAALRESRQRMTDIINFLPDATCVIDRKSTVIAWNHAMERLSGIKAKDMLGKGDYEYALPFVGRRQPVLIDMAMKPAELTKKSCVKIDKKGDFLVGELQPSTMPGRERYLHTIAAPFRDSDGNVTGAIACLRDVTEQKKAEQFLESITKSLRKKVQKRAHDLNVVNTLLRVELEEHHKTEEALRKSEQRYRAIVEDQNELICRFGSDQKITFVNEAFCRYANRFFEDLTGCSFGSLFDHDERGRIENILSILDRDNVCQTVECQGFISEGSTRWQQWTLRAIYDDHGRFSEYQAVGRDSTEQKAFELRLQQSRNMLRSVFDGIADPLIMIDRDLRVLMLNRAAIKYYDIRDYEDILGGEARGRLFGQFGADDTDRILKGIRDKKALSFDLATVGEPQRYEKISIYPVRGESRKDDTVIVRISDMTKEKILERQSSQSEKLASLGLLVSGLVHEINNPNNFIIFNMPILRDYVKELLPIIDAHARCQDQYELFQMPYEEFRSDLLTLLKNIEHGAQRINNTIGILSEFTSKRENGKRRLTNLAEVIEKAVTICQPQIRSHIKHFQVELPPDLPLIFTDPESLEQVLINLLVNAAHACDKDDSRVTLSVSKGKAWQNRFLIEVADNGCGMDTDMMNKIFEPFFTTKPQGLGTGLGLYISRSQIERLGGQIEVESRPGEGSTFRITLPDVDLKADSRIH